MWWALGIAIWLVLLGVVLAVCKAASDGDRRMEELRNKKKEAVREDRAA